MFERASKDRDQGYGLDLDEHGQEALVRAGVYHKFWEIARPHSDSFAFWKPSAQGADAEPFALMYTPRWLKKLDPFSSFGDRPECNREKLRDVLLDAMSERENTRIAFDTAVGRVSKEGEVYDRDGCSLGTYDLIVDSMGLHSPLRRHVVDDPVGKHYEGYVSFHGMVQKSRRDVP